MSTAAEEEKETRQDPPAGIQAAGTAAQRLLSVIIPVYNERGHVGKLIDLVMDVPVRMEVIVVDDGSTDGSSEIIAASVMKRHPGIRYFRHEKNRGKGAAIRTGLAKVRGDLTIIQDADFEYDPRDYPALTCPFEEASVGVVYGSRFLSGKRVTHPLHRWVNQIITATGNVLFGASLTDLETCYKVFRTPVIRSLDLESSGFEVEAELTAKLLRAGVRIVEVPISYKGRNYRQGKKITWRDGVKTMILLFKMRFFPGRRAGKREA